MRKIALALAILGTTLVSALYTAPAHAQATRTWISGVGDDANPCSRTAPCKTWAGAIAKTLAGGEIDALDPGGFGGLTITKPITLDGGGGQVASVLVAGTNGITVAAGSGDTVIIRNLRINGLLCSSPQAPNCTGSPGLTGINYISGAQVIIDTCAIFGFNTSGITVSLGATGTLQVRNSVIYNTPIGLQATATSGNFALVQVVNSTFVNSQTAGTLNGGGVLANNNAIITVDNSNFQNLNYGAQAQTGGTVNIDSSLFSSVTNGILLNGTTGNASNNSFYSGTACSGGTLNSAKNNKVGSQASAGSCTVTAMNATL